MSPAPPRTGLRPHIPLPLLAAAAVAACAAGCAPPCEATGDAGLASFELDCDRLEFIETEDTLLISLHDTTDGVIDLEMSRIGTMGVGLRFGEGGDYGMDGQYHDSLVSLADVDDSWLQVTAWEAVSGEDYTQSVAIEFHIEVEPVSTFIGGTLDGTGVSVPVFPAN